MKINQKIKFALFATVNLIMNSVVSAGTNAAPAVSSEAISEPAQGAQQISTSEFEASFLSVSASCKVSHAAFDAVSVGLEDISIEIRNIHAEVENA